MLGARQGFSARMMEAHQQVIILYCLLHRENLASRRFSPELKVVIQEVIDVVNVIKSRSLNYRIFKKMCADFGSEYVHLLYHSEVMWLSRGKVRVVALRD